MAKNCPKHKIPMEKTTSLPKRKSKVVGGKFPAKGWKKTWTCRLCPVPYRRWL